MFEILSRLTGQPDQGSGEDHDLWPEEGLAWVAEPRKYAPGLDSLLRWAFEAGASRIAFATGKAVSIRVHGRNRWTTREVVDEGDIGEICNHLYGANGVARLQNGAAIDHAYQIAIDRATSLRFRFNAMPISTGGYFGINIVLRPIADTPPSLAEQSVEAGILEVYRPSNGLVFVGGAVGSGKSTLIGGMTVAKLQDPEGHRNILEGAAPIEFLLRDGPTSTIEQTEIPRDVPSFDEFIRGCWRREPTDIIVGECRDGPTMGAAVNAAIAGSAVTSTVHVNSVALTIRRIVALLPLDERANLLNAMGQSLRLVINQRLVPSADGRRTAIREFVAFDSALRRRLQQSDPDQWEDIVQREAEGNGQSYRAAIRAALEQGRIAERTAEAELRREAA